MTDRNHVKLCEGAVARDRQWNGGARNNKNLPHVKMTGTSAGAGKSAWLKYIQECARRYQARQKADKAANGDPHAIRREKEDKERIAIKRRVRGKPVHDASHRLGEADAGKAGRRGKGG